MRLSAADFARKGSAWHTQVGTCFPAGYAIFSRPASVACSLPIGLPVAFWLGFERQFSQRDIELHVACALPMAAPKSLQTCLLVANFWSILTNCLQYVRCYGGS